MYLVLFWDQFQLQDHHDTEAHFKSTLKKEKVKQNRQEEQTEDDIVIKPTPYRRGFWWDEQTPIWCVPLGSPAHRFQKPPSKQCQLEKNIQLM